MHATRKYNVVVSGPPDAQPLLLAHGFGCDQHMWRFVTPAFEKDFRVVLFDFPGAGGSAPESYDAARHSSLDGYADDVLAIIEELDLRDVVLVGHSVAAMIGAIAAQRAPERFDKLVMVGPSPRYIDDDGYRGGFSEPDIHELLDSLASNYLGWSASMAPVIMGNADRPELGDELSASFCRMAPEIARTFARVTFLSDVRDVLPEVTTSTLVLQCSNDVIAPVEVGAYVTDAMPDARLTLLRATGHCPHLSAPEETIAAMADFIRHGAAQAV
ncbi:MAG: alpha/beta hydrolase [Nocardioides sp.]